MIINYIQSIQVECILYFNNQESLAIFLASVSELAYNPYITILLFFSHFIFKGPKYIMFTK